jgi:hypothetical protein
MLRCGKFSIGKMEKFRNISKKNISIWKFTKLKYSRPEDMSWNSDITFFFLFILFYFTLSDAWYMMITEIRSGLREIKDNYFHIQLL